MSGRYHSWRGITDYHLALDTQLLSNSSTASGTMKTERDREQKGIIARLMVKIYLIWTLEVQF